MHNFSDNDYNAELLQQAAELFEDGKNREARERVKAAIRYDSHDVDAWWALAQVAASDNERNHALKQILALDPYHAHALHMRDQIKVGSVPSLDIVTYRKREYRVNPKYRMDDSYVGRKDYALPAAAAFLGYLFFWIIGLGLNIYFLYEARQLEQNTGIKQQNVGCLQTTLGFFVILPIGFIALIIVLALLGGN
jgi:hypothetical protein